MNKEKAFEKICKRYKDVPALLIDSDETKLIAQFQFADTGYFKDEVLAQLYLTDNYISIVFMFGDIEKNQENLSLVNDFNSESITLKAYIHDYGGFYGLDFGASFWSNTLNEDRVNEFVFFAIDEFNDDAVKPYLNKLTDATF